jgi:hypothetical protein
MELGFGTWSTVCVASLAAAAVMFAAPAPADQTDDAFVAALAKGGITMPDPNTAIATAHTVCAGLDTNQNASALATNLMQDTGLSPKESGYFIGLSVAAYCPEYKGKVGVDFRWLVPNGVAAVQ